jgi:hypothetical protein
MNKIILPNGKIIEEKDNENFICIVEQVCMTHKLNDIISIKSTIYNYI